MKLGPWTLKPIFSKLLPKPRVLLWEILDEKGDMIAEVDRPSSDEGPGRSYEELMARCEPIARHMASAWLLADACEAAIVTINETAQNRRELYGVGFTAAEKETLTKLVEALESARGKDKG